VTKPAVRPPRSPAKVAIMAFGAVVLAGIVIAGIAGVVLGEGGALSPYERGQRIGQGITPAAIAAAAIGYFVQKRKLEKR
jgi:hypothetical protein